MKLFLAVLFVWAGHAVAESQCSSVWVYKPFNSCVNPANGPDLSKPGVAPEVVNEPSGWLPGSRNGYDVCVEIRDNYNSEHSHEGLHAEISRSEILGDTQPSVTIQANKYQCKLHILKYPFAEAPNAACGVADKYAEKVGGRAEDVPGAATCLSCDNVSAEPSDAMVECLHKNISEIVEPKAIELRDADLQAVAKQVELVMGRQTTLGKLQSPEERTFFDKFLAQHPELGDRNRPGGGPGTKPTQQ